MVEILGLECISNVFELILMFQGLVTLSGIAISGLLKDITGDWGDFFDAPKASFRMRKEKKQPQTSCTRLNKVKRVTYECNHYRNT